MEVFDAENCPGLVVVTDRDGMIQKANSAAEQALGERVAKGAYLAHNVHADDRAEFSSRWFELLDGTGQTGAITRIQSPDGPSHHRYVWTARYDAERNEVHAVLVPLGADPPQPRSASRLDDPAFHLRAMIDRCDISLSVLDLEGRWVVHDGKGLDKGGIRRGENLGKCIFDVYAGLDDVLSKVRKSLMQGEETHWIVDVHDLLWEGWCYPVRDERGEIVGVTIVTLDKSDEKRAMQELKNKLELIERQQEVIRNLETPIIQVWDHVVTLPMVGVVDSQRAARVMNDLLAMVVAKSAHYAILDLTGVDTVDTGTASHLIQMVSAIRLLGAEGIISGIRPTVALTLVSLGVDISSITTCSNLQEALRYCIRRLGTNKGSN